jgi:hypothetical protein
MRHAHKILVGKPEGKRSLTSPRHRWEDIRMDLREVGWEDVDWIHLAQKRDQCQAIVNMLLELRFPNDVENFLTS